MTETPRLKHVGGWRRKDRQQLAALYESVARGSGGQTVFLADDPGAGTHELLRALAQELLNAEPTPVVMAGGFEGGKYTAWDNAVGAETGAIPLLDGILTLATPLHPVIGFVSQILSTSRAARKLAKTIEAQGTRHDPMSLAPRLLRAAAEEQPVVCLVADADQASEGWWGDLVMTFAQEVAMELPLLLMVAVDGPSVLGGHHADEQDSLFAARRLVERGLAQWWPLESLTTEDLAEAIGPASSEVYNALLQVTGGRAEWASELWSDWLRRGVVERHEADDVWRFAPNRRERALAPVDDVLVARLRYLVGDTDLKVLDRVRKLLSWAALEGSRFTADAIALALGYERDEVIDMLDDVLARNEARPEGLVDELQSIEIRDEDGSRHLWLYRFSTTLDWLTLRHYGFTKTERRANSLALAEAIERLYGTDSSRMAHTLARLFEAGSDLNRALHHRRIGNVGVNRDVILWRARRYVDLPDDAPFDERRRATWLLVAAAEQLFHSGPFEEALTFAQSGLRLSTDAADSAHLRHFSGVFLTHLGDYAGARTNLVTAISALEAINYGVEAAFARIALATIALEQSDLDAAHAELTAVVEVNETLRDLTIEGNARYRLAIIERNWGSQDHAQFHAALDAFQRLGDRAGEAMVRHHLAQIEAEQGNYDTARAEFEAILDVRLEIGNRDGAAHTRSELARIDLAEGRRDKAVRGFTLASETFRELGDLKGEEAARSMLGTMAFDDGNAEKARAELSAALELQRRLGKPLDEARTRRRLAFIEFEAGNYEKAREEATALLGVGVRSEEAPMRMMLSRIEFDEGHYPAAREHLTAALELQQEFDDHEGEASARRGLALVDEKLRE